MNELHIAMWAKWSWLCWLNLLLMKSRCGFNPVSYWFNDTNVLPSCIFVVVKSPCLLVEFKFSWSIYVVGQSIKHSAIFPLCSHIYFHYFSLIRNIQEYSGNVASILLSFQLYIYIYIYIISPYNPSITNVHPLIKHGLLENPPFS